MKITSLFHMLFCQFLSFVVENAGGAQQLRTGPVITAQGIANVFDRDAADSTRRKAVADWVSKADFKELNAACGDYVKQGQTKPEKESRGKIASAIRAMKGYYDQVAHSVEFLTKDDMGWHKSYAIAVQGLRDAKVKANGTPIADRKSAAARLNEQAGIAASMSANVYNTDGGINAEAFGKTVALEREKLLRKQASDLAESCMKRGKDFARYVLDSLTEKVTAPETTTTQAPTQPAQQQRTGTAG
jgi:hypothetical protein